MLYIKNIIFNYFGNLMSIIINIGLIPFYINHLGIESYAVISLLGTLNSIFVILDLGLGMSTNREMARLSAVNGSAELKSNTVRSIECIYWLIAILIGIIVFISSSYISTHWLNSKTLSIETLKDSIKLIGLIILFRWPISFYTNVLIGFQKLVIFNIIKIFVLLVQGIGSLILLLYLKTTLIPFLIFFVGIHLLYLILMIVTVWIKNELNFFKASFSFEILHSLKKYTLGVSVFAVLGVVFPLIDKVAVSKFFSTETLGYYSLVSMIGLGVTQLIYPITSALFPRYTTLFFKKKIRAAFFEFRFSLQLVVVLSLSFVGLFYVFSESIIIQWTRNPVIYTQTSSLILPFFLGVLFYSFQIIPSLCYSSIGKTNKLNIIFAVTICLYLVMLGISVNYVNLNYIVYSWTLSNFILFILSFFLLNDIAVNSKINKYKIILSDFLFPTLIISFIVVLFKYFNIKLAGGNLFLFIAQLIILFILFCLSQLITATVLRRKLYYLCSSYVRNLRFNKN